MEIRQPARRPSQPAAAAPPPVSPGPTHTPRRKIRRNYKPLIIAVVVLLLLASLAKVFYLSRSSAISTVKKNQYQSVLLTNNQVYFGKIKKINRDYLELTNVYYFPAQQNTQSGDQSKNNQQLTLNKLGNELHGPEDAMFIERKQIIFWENLKDDSKVVQAIKSNSL